MSSKLYNGDFHSNHRILKQMIIKAGYLTSGMKPLPGPNYNESAIILKNFMAGVMGDIQTDPVHRRKCLPPMGRLNNYRLRAPKPGLLNNKFEIIISL